MTVTWTPARVRALQDLVDLTNERFATRLGVSTRTLNNWKNDSYPITQQARRSLTRFLEKSADDMKAAFFRAISEDEDEAHESTTVNLSDSANLFLVSDTRLGDARVREAQQDWARVRSIMSKNRISLAQLVAQLYPSPLHLDSTGILCNPDWFFDSPVDLSEITIKSASSAKPPVINGSEPDSLHVRPPIDADRHFDTYSHAVRDIARPRLFENLPAWRLTQVDFADASGSLEFGDMTYFDAIDVCEAVGHEATAGHLEGSELSTGASWDGLSFRRLLGDPFDLQRRAVLLSINTFTIRRDSVGASFVLHHRNATSVATSGDTFGVMPAGVFQPSTVRRSEHAQDFDLWRNIMREYSEEFLGSPEHEGDRPPADYCQEPFTTLDEARRMGKVRVYCFGIGLGALDLWAGLETVAVIDADVYDEVFANIVRFNREGSVVHMGQVRPTPQIPFTEHILENMLGSNKLAPETSLSLQLAWKHREKLLAL